MSQDPKSNETPSIFIKKVIKKGHGHHGGAWKIAYADFVTAMMAFFLLMWLLLTTKKGELEGIAEYFKTPLKIALSGGANVGNRTSIRQGGGQNYMQREGVEKRGEIKAEELAKPEEKKKPPDSPPTPSEQIDLKELQKKMEKEDAAKLSTLKSQLEKEIDANPMLKQYKNQILLEVTSKGLRVQILDEKNRPMFATGSSSLEPYVKDIIHEIGKVLNQVPNRISIAGHTDSTPYDQGEKGYSNWELSTERANAARRELINAGMTEDKVLRVVGFSSAIPLDKNDGLNPINRRISIMVLNKRTEDEALKDSF